MNKMQTAYNRVYLVRATPSPKFLASLGTSDILETLYAIVSKRLMKNKRGRRMENKSIIKKSEILDLLRSNIKVIKNFIKSLLFSSRFTW